LTSGGVVFAVAGVGKLRDREEATRALRGFRVPVPWAGPGAIALPISVLVVAGLLVATPTSRGGAIAALALIGLLVIAIGRSIARDAVAPQLAAVAPERSTDPPGANARAATRA
jgi:hypothetical protein